MNVIKKYDAYLTFETLSAQQQAELNAVFAKRELQIELCGHTLTFEFEGRDVSDCVLFVFAEAARIVRNANGELRCEIDDDEFPDPHYSFFSLRDGRLWQQDAQLVRSDSASEVRWKPPE